MHVTMEQKAASANNACKGWCLVVECGSHRVVSHVLFAWGASKNLFHVICNWIRVDQSFSRDDSTVDFPFPSPDVSWIFALGRHLAITIQDGGSDGDGFVVAAIHVHEHAGGHGEGVLWFSPLLKIFCPFWTDIVWIVNANTRS